jgi:carboxypeptidase D
MVGTAKPVQNQYSWTNLSSVLYVEQPVGTGYSLGEPNAKVSFESWHLKPITNVCLQNEEDVAAQLVGFLQQFLTVFAELKGKKFYLSGESVSLVP